MGEFAGLFINGTVGSGKTTTAEAVGELLKGYGIAHAVVDLDALRSFWPAPAADPFNLDLEIDNLAAVAANCRAAGATCLVLAGVLERSGDRVRYEAAIGGRLFVCRLRVPPDEVRRRLLSRHPPGLERQWHLDRAVELEAILNAEGSDDAECGWDGSKPSVLAHSILRDMARA